MKSIIKAAAIVFWLLPGMSYSEDAANSSIGGNDSEFRHVLKFKPMDLESLLGKNITDVVPGVTWDQLPVQGEFDNKTIRYGVFSSGKELKGIMKNWQFLNEPYCVSESPISSMFLISFNRGYVFRVELRFLPDQFSGSISKADPNFCGDETSLFNMLATKMGGTVLEEGNYRLIKQEKPTYLLRLAIDRSTATDLSWTLRGAPCIPNSCPDNN
jgi:hypothetical protein